MENSNEKIANEIQANFKMVIFGCIAALLFIAMFYVIQKPPTLEYEDLHAFGNGTMSTTPTNTSYDDGFIVPSSSPIDNLNRYMQSNFEDDLKSKSIYAFLICIPLFIIGRYVIKGVTWVNENATKKDEKVN
jgi:hypothetical protein